jgi:hypothetical protein
MQATATLGGSEVAQRSSDKNPKRKRSNINSPATRKKASGGSPTATACPERSQQSPKGSSERKGSDVDPFRHSETCPRSVRTSISQPEAKQSNINSPPATREKASGGMPAATAGLKGSQQSPEGSYERKRSDVDPPNALKHRQVALFNVTANNTERKT